MAHKVHCLYVVSVLVLTCPVLYVEWSLLFSEFIIEP